MYICLLKIKKNTDDEGVIMDSKKDLNRQEPRTIAEKTAWVLDQMIRSSQTREEHFKHVASTSSNYIVENIVRDSATGAVIKNKYMYDAINLDFIFRVIGAIESFQGAMAATWKFSARGSPKLEDIFSILVNPKGHRGLIGDVLRKKPFSEKTICRLFGIPQLARFEKQTAGKLRSLLAGVFDRLGETAWYSQRFCDEYEDIRHIYVHNYRFVFFEPSMPMLRGSYDESIIGFLKDSDNIVEGMAFIGAAQRIAMGNLVFILSNLERWIYTNLKVSILNNCIPVLPPGIPYLDTTHHNEYEKIWRAQGYNYYGSPTFIKRKIQVNNQVELVNEFLLILKKWGRPLKVYGKDGKEFEFPVEKLQQDPS